MPNARTPKHQKVRSRDRGNSGGGTQRVEAENFGLKVVTHEYERRLQAYVDSSLTFLFGKARRTTFAEIPKIFIPSKVHQKDPAYDGRRLWREIQTAFQNEANCLIREGDPDPYQTTPGSPRHWLRAVEDNESKKVLEHVPKDSFHLLHQDIGAWAYVCATRELSLCDPEFDEDRIERGDISQEASRILVTRFYDFAGAKRRYHQTLLDRFTKQRGYIKGRITWEELRGLLAGKSRRGKFGRPRTVKWKNAHRDLWLSLVWPVAYWNRWTYADVLRAERLFFGDGAPPPAEEEFEAFSERLRDPERAAQDFTFGRSCAEREWYERQLVVKSGEWKRLKSRCDVLGLKLPERDPKEPSRSDALQMPRMLMMIFAMPNLSSFDHSAELRMRERSLEILTAPW